MRVGKLILILGGARSGKSRFALELARQAGGDVLFVATAEPGDEEMKHRIQAHRKARPAGWRTLEAPVGVGERIKGELGKAQVVILDCLTLLVSNLLGSEPQNQLEERLAQELEDLLHCGAPTLIVVSNEVGLGIVPDNPLARTYRDLLGQANQILAREADEVYLMVSGIPVHLKPPL